MQRTRRPVVGLFLLFVLFALALGCRQEVPPLFRRNQPPETSLTIVPEDGATGFYRYHVYWHGQDPDGRVIRYLFAISDTLSRDEAENWNPETAEDRERGVYTEKTDSILVFDSSRGRQALSIVAIDDFGRRDRTPARAFFKTVDNGLPRVEFVDVMGFRDDGSVEAPCVGAAPCTISTFTNFRVRFSGTTRNTRIVGVQWQGVRPGQIDPEPVQPGLSDSVYVSAALDTFVMSGNDTLWSLHGGITSVFYYNRYGDFIPAGNFNFNARVKDEARLESLGSSGRRRITINHDPQTHLYRVAACDCPKPPPNCAAQDSVAVGWIVGYDITALPDSSQWRMFCHGDTIPQRAHVRFYTRGKDDRRDLPIGGRLLPPAPLGDAGFSYRFQWNAPGSLQNTSMPYSSEYRPSDYMIPPPFNTPWHGHRSGWGDVSVFQGLCPFDFSFFAASVDEWNKRDGSADSLAFFVSFSPQIDSVLAPGVIVLAPTCGFNPAACPDLSTISFGPDTLLVVGQHVRDFTTPCALGLNRFVMPLRAYGHEHPEDRNAPGVRDENRGRIKSWLYRLTCSDPGCDDIAFPGEGQWRDDVRNEVDPITQVFDDTLRVTFTLDTLVVGASTCNDVKAVLPGEGLGPYRFEVQGRDVRGLGETCTEPSSLEPQPVAFQRPVEVGRSTQLVTRTVVVRQLQDVRPYVRRAAAKASGFGMPARRLMR